MKLKLTWAMCACLVLTSNLSGAQVYKWIDANGKVQYGDQPPPDAKPLKVRSSTGTSEATAPTAVPSAQTSKKAEKPAPQIDQAVARKNCKAATEDIQNMQQVSGMSRTDANGKEHDLSASEEKAELERMRKLKDQWCGAVK